MYVCERVFRVRRAAFRTELFILASFSLLQIYLVLFNITQEKAPHYIYVRYARMRSSSSISLTMTESGGEVYSDQMTLLYRALDENYRMLCGKTCNDRKDFLNRLFGASNRNGFCRVNYTFIGIPLEDSMNKATLWNNVRTFEHHWDDDELAAHWGVSIHRCEIGGLQFNAASHFHNICDDICDVISRDMSTSIASKIFTECDDRDTDYPPEVVVTAFEISDVTDEPIVVRQVPVCKTWKIDMETYWLYTMIK